LIDLPAEYFKGEKMEEFTIDDYLALLNGDRSRLPASSAPPITAQPKKEDLTVIESTPLKAEPIMPTDKIPSSDISKFQLQNYNSNINQRVADTSQMAKKTEDAETAQDKYSQMMNKLALLQLSRVNEPMPEYKKPDINQAELLKDFQRNSNAGPEKEDIATALITSFGPGLLGLATGGNAGYMAAGKTQDYAQKVQQQALDRRQKERNSRILQSGKQLEGIAALSKSEREMADMDYKNQVDAFKIKDERLKAAADTIKDLHGKGLINKNQLNEMLIKLQEGEAKSTEKGIDEISKTEQKILDNKADIEKAKVAGAIKRQMQRPTEFNLKSAEAYASLQKANNAFNQMKKDIGYAPSTKSKGYEIAQEMFNSSQENALVKDLFKKIADPAARRQIQIELDFLAPILRKESGAAISVGEYNSYGHRYFERRNDGPETIAEKEASRRQAMENNRVSAADAPIPKVMKSNYQTPPKPIKYGPKQNEVKEIGGKKYIYKDGTWTPGS